MEPHVGSQVQLRPLEDDDLDAVISLYRSTPNYFAAIGFGREAVSKLALQRDFTEAQRTDGRTLYAIVRRHDHLLVGVADVQLEATMSGSATIELLLIGGPYQQHGYGSEAADMIERELCAAPNIELVLAGVAETSTLGQRFWQSRGYEYSGSTTHDPVTSRSTVWLAKRCHQSTKPNISREQV